MSDMTDTTDYTKIPEVLAVLPLRNIVVFPGMIVPLFVGRDKSIRALEDVMADDKQIILVAQRDGDLDDPSEEDVYDIGTVGTILQLLKLPDGTVQMIWIPEHNVNVPVIANVLVPVNIFVLG